MPATSSLVTVEYKINILAPGRRALLARGEVLRPGRTLTVTRADVFDDDGGHVATMQQTLMMLADTPDVPDVPDAAA
jgi:acyl-coenzyme A thioesterase PaaI-like protein